MCLKGNLAPLVVVAGLIILVPAPARAQSFAGVVKDTSGAVMPGVVVEAASPALIERTRTVVTDVQGQYKIVDIRPGTYSITFTLSGFSTIKREGIDLVSGFTATVNAELKVGALEETVVVSGASSIVDVQSVVSQNVLTRERQDALPTPRNFESSAVTTPGVTISRPDVGGSEGYQITNNTVHGSNSRDMTLQIDGLPATTVNGDGSNTAVYHNDLAYEEISFQTSGIGAEYPAGGIRISLVPRDGGNTFKGQGFAAYTPGSLQSNNFTSALKAAGLTAGPSVLRIFDYNAAFGGPIRRDKLWFFATARYWGVDQGVPGEIDNSTGGQGVNDNLLKNVALRVTWQVSPRNKLALSSETTPKWMGHHGFGAGVESSLATRTQETPRSDRTAVKWSSPVTNKLLLEAGGLALWYDATYFDHAGVAPNAITRVDLITGTTTIAPLYQQLFFIHTERAMASATYVTGSHAVKVGMQFGHGSQETDQTIHGDMIQQYSNGVPSFVQVRNTPTNLVVDMNADVAVYAQDVWTLKRMTISGGLRFDHLNASVPVQTAAAGAFVPARNFDAIPNLPNWSTISPRLGVAYDLFGNSKTAIKASVGEYVQNAATGFATTYNPMISDTDTRTWKDLNGDNVAQPTELGPSQNKTFGIRQNEYPDPNIKRPFEMEYVVKIDHQLARGVAVSGGYYRRGFHRLLKSTNLSTSLSDYSPLTILSPLNGEAITIYSISPAKLGLVNILSTNSTSNSQTYNGFEASFDARLGKKLMTFAGVTVGRTIARTCDVQDNPNLLRFCDQSVLSVPFQAQYKLSGAYQLPMHFQVSGVFASYPGVPMAATGGAWLGTTNYIVSKAIAPGLTQTSVTVPLVPPGGNSYFDRLSQLDLRVARSVRVNHVDLTGALDIFNAMNASTVFNQIQTYGSALGRPTDVMQGRVFRFGLQVKF
jgi:hypothetical protein